jgi:UDP-GlcNAc3NAcA epimerase
LRIVTVVGARPQFIKAAVVSAAIRAAQQQRGADITEILVHTGQHYDANMSQVFFDELDLPLPAYNLGIGGLSHGAQTGRMLERLDEVLMQEKPDWVLIYGDTNSTLAGALAAAKLHLRTAHVEAGLRSFNRLMPEEINRVVADHVADLLLAPTDTAVANLRAEGIPPTRIRQVGDVMCDAVLRFARKAEATSHILACCRLAEKDYFLATVHRAENTDYEARLRALFAGLERIAALGPVVLPLHPRTRGVLARLGMLEHVSQRLRLIEPVGYLDMMMLQRAARAIITDSGGIQKEAYLLSVPCITLRDETEWVETVETGWNILVSADAERLVGAVSTGTRPTVHPPLYGDGQAAERIVAALLA